MAVLDLLASPAAFAAVASALTLPALTGFPNWPSPPRGRLASTLASSAAGAAVYALVARLAAPTAG